jgi:DNA-binding CsgD family transcriptional regulator
LRDLTTSDLRQLNKSVLQLNSEDDPETFPGRISRALKELISCDFAAIECFGRAGWKGRLLDESNGVIETHFDAFLRLGTAHPLFPAFLSGFLSHESLRLSEVTNRSDLLRLDIYDQFLKPINVDVQMAVSVPLQDGTADVLILNRKGRDFSDREKQMLTAFLPHIVLARRRSHLLSATSYQTLPNGALKEPFLVNLQEVFALSRRESEVIWWMALGKSDEDIANICDVSRRTIGKHCENIYRKLGVECRTAAVTRALRLHT